jgi:hypothetical protein
MDILVSTISALRYELARTAGARATRAVALLALLASAVLTLPAARQIVGLVPAAPGHPALPGHRGWQPPPFGHGAWVVAAGVVGALIPGAVAACGAAWLGASSVKDEYRHGNALITYALVPRRRAVLVAKAIVAVFCGAFLCAATTASAYAMARLGFEAARTKVAMPLGLLVPAPRAVAFSSLAGVVGVLGGAVLRLRVLTAALALAVCGVAHAVLPGSSSPAEPRLSNAVRKVSPLPGMTSPAVLGLALGLVLFVLAVSALVAVSRRRVG